LVREVIPVTQVLVDSKVRLADPERRVSLVALDCRDPLEALGLQATKVHLDNLVSKVKLAQQDHLESREFQDHKVLQEELGSLEPQVHLDSQGR